MSAASPSSAPNRTLRRGFWLKQVQQWHWISAAVCLVGMLLFAATGFTLNHAGSIEATPEVVQRQLSVPAPVLAALAAARPQPDQRAALPPSVRDWLADTLDVATGAAPAQWLPGEVYLSLPRPGGDAWLAIDTKAGTLEYERTERGWIAYLNDLHKGRNAGPIWAWFIDVFALACVVFCVTGLLLLQLHAAKRPTTWPMVGLGVLVPLVLALLFIH